MNGGTSFLLVQNLVMFDWIFEDLSVWLRMKGEISWGNSKICGKLDLSQSLLNLQQGMLKQ